MPAARRIQAVELLPHGLMEGWRSAIHPSGARSLAAEADLLETLRSEMSPDRESAGSIGDGWFTCASGDARQVRAERSPFTWHSHPSGPAIFSIEDFATFRLMDGRWHLLVTPTSWCVYLAVGAPVIAMPEPATLVGPPMLRARRWTRWLEQVLGGDPDQLDHARLCELFGVRRFDSIEALAGVVDRRDEVARTCLA